MKISVLMSVYKKDDPQFLALALESIYEKQTRKPDEVIVVFDGELTAELHNVLDAFQKGKEDVVKYYPQAINRGLGEALRIGSELCTGEYIFRMDSDDISAPDRFEKQLAYLSQHPETDVLGTDITEFQNSPDEAGRKRVCPAEHEQIVKMGKKRNPMNHVTVAMRRSALEKCGGYETLLLLEDYYLWLKMIAAGCRLANMNETMVYVRVGNGFNERRGSSTRIKGWKQLQKFMLQHKMVTKAEAFMNMVYIYGFVYCPGFVRNFAYKTVLRR